MPHWYVTTAAWLVWILCADLLTWGVVQLRTLHLVRRRRELERLVAERTSELNKEKLALAGAREELQQQATHDSLTGVWNRGAILEHLHHEIERGHREGKVLTIVMAGSGPLQADQRYQRTCLW